MKILLHIVKNDDSNNNYHHNIDRMNKYSFANVFVLFDLSI